MEKRLIISLEEFPEEGRWISGELDGALFDIDCDSVRSSGSVRYDLELQLYDTELLLRGSLSAPFRLRCDRCLSDFDYELCLEDVAISLDVKAKLSVDVTDELREEMLLELPNYPKCEISGLKCKINDEFGDFRLDKDPQTGVDSATPSGNSVWDALDQFPRK